MLPRPFVSRISALFANTHTERERVVRSLLEDDPLARDGGSRSNGKTGPKKKHTHNANARCHGSMPVGLEDNHRNGTKNSQRRTLRLRFCFQYNRSVLEILARNPCPPPSETAFRTVPDRAIVHRFPPNRSSGGAWLPQCWKANPTHRWLSSPTPFCFDGQRQGFRSFCEWGSPTTIQIADAPHQPLGFVFSEGNLVFRRKPGGNLVCQEKLGFPTELWFSNGWKPGITTIFLLVPSVIVWDFFVFAVLQKWRFRQPLAIGWPFLVCQQIHNDGHKFRLLKIGRALLVQDIRLRRFRQSRNVLETCIPFSRGPSTRASECGKCFNGSIWRQ